MKKTYIIPTLEIVKIQSVRILAGSIPQGDEYEEGNPVLSRRARFSTWEDEEEEF